MPYEYHAEVLGERRDRSELPMRTARACLRRGRPRRHLPAAAGGGGQLAARRADAGLAAAVRRRRSAHRAAGGRDLQHRVARGTVRRHGTRASCLRPARPPHRLRGGSSPRAHRWRSCRRCWPRRPSWCRPLFMSSGPGLELLHPLAVTMLGGLVTLLLVQGLLLPALLLPGPDRTAVGRGRSRPIPSLPGAGTASGSGGPPTGTTVREPRCHRSTCPWPGWSSAPRRSWPAAPPPRPAEDTAGPDQAGRRLADRSSSSSRSARSSGWAS